MRVVHASDWHWHWGPKRNLPEADLYIFTGDMMDNYPQRDKRRDRFDLMGGNSWDISPDNERFRQTAAAKHFVEQMGGMKKFLGSQDAPVIAVRGNHDFIDISLLFDGCNFVHEFKDNELVEVLGKKVSGHRGIPYIYGSWNDEVQRPDLMDRVRAIPDGIDILLTHYPPSLVLDMEIVNGGRGVVAYGLEGMSHMVFNKLNPGGLHCFGHIHGAGGRIEKIDGEYAITFSNAATTFNVIDI